MVVNVIRSQCKINIANEFSPVLSEPHVYIYDIRLCSMMCIRVHLKHLNVSYVLHNRHTNTG